MKHLFVKQPILAIDIGSSSIKILEFTGSGRKRKVTAMGLEVLPKDAIVDGVIRDHASVKKVLKRLLVQLEIETKNRRVGLSISGNAVILKRIVFMRDEGVDPGEQLFEEAKQHFHNSLDDMYFRYQLIDSDFVQSGEQAAVIVAAKIGVVEQHVQLMHELGLKVGVIDCDTFCLANMFQHNFEIQDELVAIVNIGATTTQVFLQFNDEFLFSREVYIGGDHITEAIAESLGIEFENAESLKLSASSGETAMIEQIEPAVSEILSQLANEVETTVNFFLDSEDYPESLKNLNYVHLCGGGALTHKLAESISNALQAPVSLINPFNRVDLGRFGADVENMLSQGPLYGVCVGLALRKLNDSGKQR